MDKKKLTDKEWEALEKLQQFDSSRSDKEETPRTPEKLGMDRKNLEALHAAGMLDKESLELQLDKQGDKPLEAVAAGEELQKQEDVDAKAKLKQQVGAVQEGMKEGNEKADAQIASASRSAENYGSRMVSEGRDSFAEALEKLKTRRRG
jgi:hypothetical protein